MVPDPGATQVGGIPVPTHIRSATRVPSAGNKPKTIDEFVGCVNSKTPGVSIARMHSPCGWTEPAQTPQFDEYTIVLKGMLRVTHKSGSFDVLAGQAVIAHMGEWIQYSTPLPEGAEYVAVCVPGFRPELANRDPS